MSSPSYHASTVSDRPDLRERIEAITQQAWPEFMHHDPVARANWSTLYGDFAGFQFALAYHAGSIVSVGNSIPLLWEAGADELPDGGWDWAMQKGVDDARAGRHASVLCGLQVVIPPEHRGKGVSANAIRAMKAIAEGPRPARTDRPGAARLEVPLPAYPDGALRSLADRRRVAVRSVAASPRPRRRKDREGLPSLHDHHGDSR